MTKEFRRFLWHFHGLMAGTELEVPKLLLTKTFLNHSCWWGTCLQAQECWGYGSELESSSCLGIHGPKGPTGRDQKAAAPLSQKSFRGKTGLCPINTCTLTFSIGRHLHTHSTDSTLPQRPLHNKCLFPHQVSENMQIQRKAFEILLLCFPSKHFLFISPLTAPISSSTLWILPSPGCGVPHSHQWSSYSVCLLLLEVVHALATLSLLQQGAHRDISQSATADWHPHRVHNPSGLCPVPTDVVLSRDPGPALTLLWGGMWAVTSTIQLLQKKEAHSFPQSPLMEPPPLLHPLASAHFFHRWGDNSWEAANPWHNISPRDYCLQVGIVS